MASWIITDDIINNGKYEGEFCGNIEKCKYKFRLLDDDDEVYFVGLSGSSSSFDPMDGFGSAFGCTDIQYFENGKWESL